MENRLACPYCGTPVKGNENFCRYCGRLIRGSVSDARQGEEHPQGGSMIPQEVLEQLEIRVQLNEIDSKMQGFREEVKEMDTMLKNADIPLAEYRERIAKLKEETSIAKGLRAELEEKKQSFPFEQHRTEYQELKEKIEKLEKLRATRQIGDDAHKSLTREYQLRKREIENMINNDTYNLKNWINVLTMERNDVKKQIEIMSAKQAVGDLPDKEYADIKEKLEIRLSVAEYGVDLLKRILSQN